MLNMTVETTRIIHDTNYLSQIDSVFAKDQDLSLLLKMVKILSK